MSALIIPLLTIILIYGAVRFIFLGSRARAFKNRILAQSNLSEEDRKRCVASFGRVSNSFMTLYPGFEYFTSPRFPGYIAFVDTTFAWVAGAEPVTPEENVLALLEEFTEAAGQAGKRVLVLPVSLSLVNAAKHAGYGRVLIGSEPLFDLKKYPPTGKTWIDVVTTAKTLSAKGAQVREISPLKMSDQDRKDLDQIKMAWLASRKTVPLGFLNQVDPWYLVELKKFFVIELKGKVLAFLAAIPIPAKNSWYLIDLLRLTETPAGTTELLLLQTMKQLAADGVSEATHGVSPLSNLDFSAKGADPVSEHPWLYRVLTYLFTRGEWIYNFQSLYQFKLKFLPTHSAPVYLIYKDARKVGRSLGWRDAVSIGQAFFPNGLSGAAGAGILRTLGRFRLSDFLKSELKPGIVVKSVPPTWQRLLSRCKVTVILGLLFLTVYFWSLGADHKVNPELLNRWSFSWELLRSHPVQALLLSPFLHWNAVHLSLNLLLMTLFTGTLEYFAGTGVTVLCFLIPAIFANFLTALLLGYVLPVVYQAHDVGGSLGIFGCAGALHWFLKRAKFILWILFLGQILLSAVTGEWIGLDHGMAIILGIGTGWICLRGSV